jgi:hypothetical protein
MTIALKCKKASYIASAARNDGWTLQYMYIPIYNKLPHCKTVYHMQLQI